MREEVIPTNDAVTKHIVLAGPVLLSATLPDVSSNYFGLKTLQM